MQTISARLTYSVIKVPFLGTQTHYPYSFKLGSVGRCLRFGEVLPTIGGLAIPAHVSGLAWLDCLGALAAWLAPRSSSDPKIAQTRFACQAFTDEFGLWYSCPSYLGRT